MALRVGEMMVVVRAQDFASRTLRRVGSEMHGLSQDQRRLMLRQQMYQRQMATTTRKVFNEEVAMATKRKALAQDLLNAHANMPRTTLGTFGPGMGTYNRARAAAKAAGIDMANANAEIARGTKLLEEQMAVESRLAKMRRANFGHMLSGIGRTLQLVGLIGVGIGAATSNFFAGFNRQVSLAATQTSSTAAGIVANAGRMQKAIINMMKEFPATGEEMASAAYDIFSSMDVSFGGGMDLLRKFNKLSVATLTDLETATNAGITVLNVFDKTGKHTNETLNTMVAIIRYGRMRLSDFNEMMNKIAPAAENAHQSLIDVAGAMALITRLQPSQRQVATGIARLLQVFSDPEFQQGLSKASKGLARVTDKTGKMRPLLDIVKDIKENFGDIIGKRGVETFLKMTTAVGRGTGRGRSDRIEAQRALTFLVNNLGRASKLQNDIKKDTNEWIRSYNVMRRSPGVRWEVMINQFRALALVLGEALIPAFLSIGNILLKAVQWFQGLSDTQKKWIGYIVAATSAISLLGGVLLGIVGPIIAISAAFDGLMVAAPWLALAAVIGVAAIYVITHWEKVKKWFNDFFDWLGIESLDAAQRLVKPFTVLPGFLGGDAAKRAHSYLNLLQDGIERQKAYRQQLVDTRADLEKLYKTNPKEFFHIGDILRKQLKRGVSVPEIKKQMQDQLKIMNEIYKAAHGGKKGSLDQMLNDALGGNWKSLQEQLGGQNLQDMYQQQLDTAKSAKNEIMDTFRQLYTSLEQQNRQFFGGLFQGQFLQSPTFDLGKEWGITPAVNDMITDLEQQNVRFQKWRTNMGKLIAEGVPRGLIDELSQMGMDTAEPFMNKLVEASPAQIAKLIQQWKKREGAIKSATQMDFSTQINQFNKAGHSMGQAIINGFQASAVGPWFDHWVKKTFPGVINAAVATAVKTFQDEHKLQIPKAKATPTAPKAKRYQGGHPVSYSNNNSRTQTIAIHMTSSGDAKQDARMAAWKAKHTLKELV